MVDAARLAAAADCEARVGRGWELVEMLSAPRPGHRIEDAVLVSGGYVGIFDGCTAKRTDWPHEGSPGALASLLVSSAFAGLDRDATCAEAVEHATAALRHGLERRGVADDGGEGPSTTMLVLSLHREELWCVGDGHALVDGAELHFDGPPSDKVVSGLRSLYHSLLVAGGAPAAEVLERDPAHELVRPVLEQQWRVRNDAGSPWGYGSIDGSPVPASFQHVVPLDGAHEVVLASDGYLSAAPTLALAEAELEELAERDPLASPSTRRRAAGSAAFDDRSYLRLAR